jgi:hypothetical protein
MLALAEKSFICLALLATFPLFFFDKEILGLRRFAWLITFCTGLCVTLILNPHEELAQALDKVTMAAVSITIVPHFMALVKENVLLGIGFMAPFYMVVHMSLETRIGTIDYWKLRAFMHLALFLPYFNHLPKDPPATNDDDASEPQGIEKTDEKSNEPAAKTSDVTVKSKRTNKKKR